jgi:hypothetical protein
MKRLLTLVALLALSGTAMAGFSLGFKPLDLPQMVYDGSYDADGINMLRIGWGASEDFRIEVLAGYEKVNLEESDSSSTEQSSSCFAMGLSGFYVIASPSNTVFSIGGSFVYSKTSSEYENVDGPETTGYSFYPIMRVDFAIPGAERFGLFTEFGARYVSATTSDDSDTEWKVSDFGTWGSENILGGAYYSF